MGTIYTTLVITDEDDIDITLDITGYLNPSENGGWDSPSWSAYIDDISATYPNGSPYTLSKLEVQLAEEALWDAVEGQEEYEADMDDYWREEEGIRRAEIEYEDRMYR